MNTIKTAQELLALKAEREARRKAMEAVQVAEDEIVQVVDKADEKIVEETIEEEKVNIEKANKKGGKKKKATPTRSFMTVEENESVFVAPEAFGEAVEAIADHDEE
jgi:hypothetical protein